MRVGIAGKGGVGKTTISSVLARTLARRGHRVIAVDCDSDPHLAMNSGIDAARIEAMVPLVERRGRGGSVMSDEGATPVQLLSKHGIEGPDGVTFLQASRITKPGGG
ncbi:MAG: nucleotide-binding protein [Actinomycetota bacterium]